MSRSVLLSLAWACLGQRGSPVDEVAGFKNHSTIVDAWLLEQVHHAQLAWEVVLRHFPQVGIDSFEVGFSEVLPMRALPDHVMEVSVRVAAVRAFPVLG